MKKIFNLYDILARYLPSLMSALPFFVIWFYLSENFQLKSLSSFIMGIKIFGVEGISFSLVFIYIFSLVIREISKYFERKYFTGKRAKGFPTTYLMTYSDSTLSDRYKDKYRELIFNRFGFELSFKDAEHKDSIEARKRLNEATRLVIAEMGNVHLVLLHNIWFGSLRNLIGGTIISMPLCIGGIAIGWFLLEKSIVMIFVLTTLFLLYVAVFLFRKPILTHNGEAYAQKLFAEFIKAHT